MQQEPESDVTQQFEVQYSEPQNGTAYHELEPIDPLDEELLAEEARRRPGKLTLTLAAAIVVAGAFAGGVLVQKHYGGSNTSGMPGGGNFAARSGGNSEGFPAGGFGGGASGYGGGTGGFGAGTGAGTGQGAGAGAGASTATGGGTASGSGTSATPAVVGTLTKISGKTLTVKNFGGKSVKVTMTDATTITMPASLTELAKGTAVSVVGTKADDGSVKATAVTATK